MAVHLVSAAVYLGISFGFKQGERSDIFMAWYLVSGVEAIITILLSNFYAVLSFARTHLIKRLTLLTVIIIGDGIIQVAREVVTIVKNPDAWGEPLRAPLIPFPPSPPWRARSSALTPADSRPQTG